MFCSLNIVLYYVYIVHHTIYVCVSLAHRFNSLPTHPKRHHDPPCEAHQNHGVLDPRSFPQRNGDVFAFTPELNEVFMHGVPHVMPNSPAAMEPEDARSLLLATLLMATGNPALTS